MKLSENVKKGKNMSLSKILMVSLSFVIGASGAVRAYERMSDAAIVQLSEDVRQCFRETEMQDDIGNCLAIPSDAVSAAGGFDRSMSEMATAHHDIFRVMDLLLNVEYQSTIRTLRGADGESENTVWDTITETWVPLTREEMLREAQRAWIGFRDAECRVRDWTMINASGSSRSMISSGCIAGFTVERVRELIFIRVGGYGIGTGELNYK